MEFKIYRANEDELIKGCLRRDRNAQRLLYDTFSSKMYGLSYRYVKDSMEAEDIVVTAFTKIFNKIDQFRGEGSFEGWIKRIVVNEALGFLRKNKPLYLETDLNRVDRDPQYNQLTDHLEAEDLIAMIQELPTGYRIVFNLYAIDGYSHKEIAEQLGINENTSKSQLSRARLHLQKILAENDCVSKQKVSNNESATT